MGIAQSSPAPPERVMTCLRIIRNPRMSQYHEDNASRIFVNFPVWADRIVEVAKEDPWYITKKNDTTELLQCINALQVKYPDAKIMELLRQYRRSE